MATAMIRDQDQYSCSICLELMKDPVTIPCGHSYCMSCIRSYWDKDEMKRNTCPQCRQNFKPRPVLNKNTILAEIMETLRNTKIQNTTLAQTYAESGDVECDFCTGDKVRAVKSCLECRASYCETHLQPHFDIPALKRHKLVNPCVLPTCQKHDKLLEVFCKTDQKCICVLCLMDDHKGHDTVSCSEEREEKQVKLEADKSKFEKKFKEKEKELSELQKSIQSHVDAAQKAVMDTEKTFNESVSIIKKRHSEVIERIRAQEKSDLDRLGGFCEKLEMEIDMLRKQGDVLDRILHTEDNIYFLQNFEKILVPPAVEDCQNQSLELVSSFGQVSHTVSHFKEKLEEFCKQEADTILENVPSSSIKASQKSPGQIKIGDRVCVKSTVKIPKFNWGSHVTHKSIGEVKALHGNTLIVSFPGHKNWKGVLSEMELVNDSIKPAQSCSIKVGDRVRVKSSVDTPKHKWGGVTHQSVGVVKSIDGDNMTVDFAEHSEWKGIVPEMEVVSADEVSGSLSANYDFQIGDSVRVKSTVVTPKHQWGGVTHKSVGVVTDIKEGTVTVDFPECKGWKGIVPEMELISVKKGNFSIGDHIRVKGSISSPKRGWGSVSHKSVGVVKALNGDIVTVDFPEHKSWKGISSEMELVDSEYCKFKLGDKVQVKSSVGTPKYNWGSISQKSVGTIKALKLVVDFPEQSDWNGDPSEMELAS